ncbi:DExH-box ATP-dependent RNA helicase DExH13 isoform X2 [Eutrema salsugineum]|uniref:DExH-box ATP-dependent RNA helicase DExH13 isoform X2 n=1 Tax=Eutrema salsugineum TaxID=72664 RepID=UPI000CECEB07|nr:DExH-box ATP-dependent RNA helicase DExH13 isoform X2 [Eutrema salsugineum]
MSNLGGGAEEQARLKQYGYKANSNLVLNPDERPRDTHEPTGEPETLRGKIDPKSFGDRVVKGKSNELDERLNKSKKKKEREATDDLVFVRESKRRRLKEESVLTDTDDGVYQPMLSLIQQQLGGQPLSIVCGAADEILAVLKNDSLKNIEKKMEIEKLLNPIPTQIFDQLVSIGKLITDYGGDYGTDEAVEDEGLDYDVGVALEFEEHEEDDEESDLDMVQEEKDEEDEEGAAPNRTGGVQVGVAINAKCAEHGGSSLNVQEIDAYWLQRKIFQGYEQQIDPQECQVLAEELLNILAEGTDRDVENKLLEHLQFDKFSLVKFLLQNRLKIVWCTRLAREKNQEERNQIEEEMMGLGPGLAEILEELHAKRATAKEREENQENKIKEEARGLKDDFGGDEDRGRRDVDDRDLDNGWFKGQRQMLDLESLAFDHGGILRENKKCELPSKSYRIHGKEFDEVHVPWVSKKFDCNEKLVKITDMPDWAQPAFKGMQQLNRVQSKVYETALFKAENILLCAPTGAGKTNVAVLTILQQLELNTNSDGNYKIVYVAPMKALVVEVVDTLSKRLKDYGVTVKELSGDQSLTRQEIEEAQIIVTTPEKWDIVTRKSGDRTYTQLVRLLIIDEIHLLNDSRGPVLESIVARTLRQIETTKQHIRLVGLSATLPNHEDVASFLRVDLKGGLFTFDRSYRPVPLSQQYIGINVKKPLRRFQLMNDICYQKVLAGAGKHQVLIFVHSRKETAKTARAIQETAIANDTLSRFLKEDSNSREILQSQVELVKSSDLKDLLPYGFAIHHAGLTRSDRQIVEDQFRLGHVQVLISTATLAWGVNLPAHTVIIKGTQVYNPERGAWMELSPLDVMQMIGRAGRPQYDQHGEGIIITGYSELQYYLRLMNEQLPIESQFISKLADQLNAEIVLGTIQNAREACHWLGYTYLNVRMVSNPTLYGLPPDAVAEDIVLEERRADLIHSAATILYKNNLIMYDKKSGYFQVTDLGRIASYYYISHGTIATYNENLKPTMSIIDLCRLFSLSEEFKYVTVRQDEKMEMAKLLDRVPIPVKETLQEPSAKINVLLQAYISKLKLEGLSLTSDMVYINQSAGRLLRALFEIVLKRGWAQLAEKALKLSKMVGKKMWSVQTPLRQFHGIPNEVLMKLEKKDLVWERYYDLSSHELGEIIRNPKMGRPLHKIIHQFPKLNLAAHVQPISHSVLQVELTITPDFQWDDKVHKYVEPFWIIVEDNDGEKVLHHEYFLLKKQYIDEDHTLNFTVPISEPPPPQYFIRVVSDKWLDSPTVLPVSFRHLILPQKYPPPTELLDLQPLPMTALRNPSYETLYQDFKHFNPVQTQVFSVLYNTSDNVLVAAATGSGKTICAEFAILRNHHEGSDSTMRVVYIAPLEAIAKEQFRDWEEKFGKGLGLRVVELTGETALDLKLLEKGQIIISTPEKWDALSRWWKQRKYVQQVSLFIVDELHLIGGQGGPVLEVIVSRMRYIASQVGNKIRIVALSTSLANAKDLGEWIGASSRGLFNFPPNVRPVPLEIHIQGVDILNFEARMQAMTKPTYTAIVQHAKNKKPAIVFVPSRKHARLTAVDLLAYSHMDNTQSTDFLSANLEELEPFVSQICEETLKKTLRHGIGYLHEGLSSLDQEIVSQLFKAGRIQVCVMTSSLCWGTPLKAHLVVVMGTQFYDGRKNSHSDYPISDLLQMMGRCSRPLLDNAGKCVIFCHSVRKEYYKKFLHEAFPVESHLQHYLHDNFNAEVVAGVIENKQDAVDYLTWSLMYRGLPQNPNFYNLQGVSHRHLSDHLSELVENTLSDLEVSKCIEIDNELDLSPLNLGMIASYYYISYTTIERFSSLLASKTKMKGLLEILTSASEFDLISIRPGEEDTVRRLINHQRFSFENPKCTDPHVKANALLQAHFSRQKISGNLAMDQREVLLSATRLLQAMVDVISSNGCLDLALLAMEVSQIVTQGMWDRDSILLQLPHFTKDLAKRCQENPGNHIENVFDLVEMEDDRRQELLQMSDAQLLDIARFCNRFPNIDLIYEVVDSSEVTPGKEITLQVMLERDMEGRTEVGPVDAPRYPKTKEEGWWLVVGETKTNQLLAIKRIFLQRKAKVKLAFAGPTEPGEKSYTLYFMSDSYLGCDQEYTFSVDVKDSCAADHMEE